MLTVKAALEELMASMDRVDAQVILSHVLGVNRAYMNANAAMLGHFVGRKIRTFPREAGVSTYLELVKEGERRPTRKRAAPARAPAPAPVVAPPPAPTPTPPPEPPPSASTETPPVS